MMLYLQTNVKHVGWMFDCREQVSCKVLGCSGGGAELEGQE
jgi:hypothetical protein